MSSQTRSMDPPPYIELHEQSASPLLFLCDHGGDVIPHKLRSFNWDQTQGKHVRIDIGAAAVAKKLSDRFNATAVIGVYSRLVVDLNRFSSDPTFIPEVSDGIDIPGNRDLSPEDISWRTDSFYAPYHMRIEQRIDTMLRQGLTPRLVLVHSMAASMNGIARPEQIDIMYDRDESLSRPVLDELLKIDKYNVGDNEPYCLDDTDYTAVVHGVRRNLPHFQLELRQDLLMDNDGICEYATVIGNALEACDLAETSTNEAS